MAGGTASGAKGTDDWLTCGGAHPSYAEAYPGDIPLRDELTVAIIGRGGSAVLAPDGSYLAGPLYDTEGTLFAELDPDRLRLARQKFDPVGHYHRPDVLSLTVSSPNQSAWPVGLAPTR